VLSWEFSQPPAPDHRITVLSSVGGTDWQNVTERGLVDTEGQSFIDLDPLSRRRTQDVLYRLVVQTDGNRWDSPSVQATHTLRPHEFAMVRTILARELHSMRVGDGVEVLLLKPLTYGEPADSFDETTGQLINPSTDISGFGERFRGGYFAPMRTHMRFISQQDAEQRDGAGQGVRVMSRVGARAFCFPRPAFRDLVINPLTNDRYLVNTVNTHRFRGVVPVMADIQLDLLSRDDIRYRLDPENVTTTPNNV